MAFGLNANQLVLKEAQLYVGTWTNPQTIGNGVVGDPESLFTGDAIGYAQQGGTVIGLTRTYAEALSGTPSIRVAKDLVTKNLSFTLNEFQFNADLFDHSMGLLVQAGYTAAGFTGDLGWIGSNEPGACSGASPFNGYLMKTETINCVPLKIAIWYGKPVTEDMSLTMSGTDYVTRALQIDAFVSPDFGTTTTDAQKHYGMIWLDNS